MKNIIVLKKDGTRIVFEKENRAGGSYGLSIRYDNGFAIIKDTYDNETIYPSSEIEEILTTPER